VSRILPRIVVGMVLGWAVLVSWGCERDGDGGPRSPGSQEVKPDQEIEQFVLEETIRGKVEWVLRSKWAAIYEKEQLIRLTGVRLEFRDSGGAVSSTLTSDKGLLERGTNTMEADGHVSVSTRDSVELKTDQLVYSGDDNMIRTEGFVEISRGEDVVTGYGLESDPELKHFEIKREVKGRIHGSSKEL